MKYRLLRLDYLTNIYSRVLRNIAFLEQQPEDSHTKERLFYWRKEKLEVEESLEKLKEKDGQQSSFSEYPQQVQESD